MHKDGAVQRPEANGSPEELAFIQAPYHDDVRRLLNALDFHLPTYEKRLEAETYALIRDNLQILRKCFYGEPLTPEPSR